MVVKKTIAVEYLVLELIGRKERLNRTTNCLVIFTIVRNGPLVALVYTMHESACLIDYLHYKNNADRLIVTLYYRYLNTFSSIRSERQGPMLHRSIVVRT